MIMDAKCRTRFAPSPTGLLHIGSVRTALYSYALARKNGGQFLLRIEDTDQERKVQGSVSFLLRELAWLGLVPDEGPSHEDLEKIGEPLDCISLSGGQKGPYVQSLRREIYRQYAEELIQKGFAYRCDCTPEMLERERLEQIAKREKPGYSGRCRYRNVGPDVPHAVRLRLPDNFVVEFYDAIKGLVRFENPPLKDPVILKSDGLPTYHLAVVVDDHLMEITHVLRGDEWLSTAPIHIYLYDIFGWEKPVFAHLPVILGEDGKKLSKRHGACTTEDLRQQGYLPQAILNALALVGWSHPEGKELFSLEEFIEVFDLERVHASSGIFSFSKLNKFNHEHIKRLSKEEFSEALSQKLGKSFQFSETYLKVIQERTHTLEDLNSLLCFLDDEIKPDFSAISLDVATLKQIIASFKEYISTGFSRDGLKIFFEDQGKKFGLKKESVFKAIRIATLCRLETPPLIDTLLEMGREWTEKRLISAEQALGN
jgi:glutamyl-tRNA synthetase